MTLTINKREYKVGDTLVFRASNVEYGKPYEVFGTYYFGFWNSSTGRALVVKFRDDDGDGVINESMAVTKDVFDNKTDYFISATTVFELVERVAINVLAEKPPEEKPPEKPPETIIDKLKNNLPYVVAGLGAVGVIGYFATRKEEKK